jgi:hypothetical protein
MKIDRNKYRKSRFLKAADLTAVRVPVTITGWREEEFRDGDDKQLKPVIELKGTKPLILNDTNFGTLYDEFGDETEAWSGKRIALVKQKGTFQGRRMDVIRIEALIHTETAG